MELIPWDYWCQTADPAQDGDGGSGNNAPNDCGPECASMALAYLSGVVLDADYIKDCMKGAGYQGYTSLDDLVRFFHTTARTPASIRTPTSREQWLWTIWHCLTRGHPSIGLFSFSAPGAADGHFRCLVGMGSDRSIISADPWTGSRRVETWDNLWSWAKGPIIEIQRQRSILP